MALSHGHPDDAPSARSALLRLRRALPDLCGVHSARAGLRPSRGCLPGAYRLRGRLHRPGYRWSGPGHSRAQAVPAVHRHHTGRRHSRGQRGRQGHRPERRRRAVPGRPVRARSARHPPDLPACLQRPAARRAVPTVGTPGRRLPELGAGLPARQSWPVRWHVVLPHRAGFVRNTSSLARSESAGRGRCLPAAAGAARGSHRSARLPHPAAAGRHVRLLGADLRLQLAPAAGRPGAGTARMAAVRRGCAATAGQSSRATAAPGCRPGLCAPRADVFRRARVRAECARPCRRALGRADRHAATWLRRIAGVCAPLEIGSARPDLWASRRSRCVGASGGVSGKPISPNLSRQAASRSANRAVSRSSGSSTTCSCTRTHRADCLSVRPEPRAFALGSRPDATRSGDLFDLLLQDVETSRAPG